MAIFDFLVTMDQINWHWIFVHSHCRCLKTFKWLQIKNSKSLESELFFFSTSGTKHIKVFIKNQPQPPFCPTGLKCLWSFVIIITNNIIQIIINQLIISVPFLNIFFVSCQTFTVRETTCFLMFHLNATHFLPSFLWSIKVMVNYHCVKSLTRLYTPGASFSSLPWSSKACGTEEPLINWLIMLMIFFTVYELILCASNNITICD